MAVLSKAGCNSGTCHGNLNGKNGFKLSLRGDDPAWDYNALTRDAQGRRVDVHNPEQSLILLKAIGHVPHEGGKRFAVDSQEYRILRGWIAAGRPVDAADAPRLVSLKVTPTEAVLIEPKTQVRIKAEARFSDGSVRDVTRLACYESSHPAVQPGADGTVERPTSAPPGVVETAILVRYLNRQAVVRIAFVPERRDFAWQPVPEHNPIDRFVFAKLKQLRIQPSDVCSDEVFLRRAYLDTLGLIPTADEARAFLADRRADKRARLIDTLLQRPEFADHWALKWADLLRNEEKSLDKKGVQVFHNWIRQSIAEGKPLNEFAREIVAARGSTYANPPTNFYRALREPHLRSEAVAQVFLGIRLQCARCHNHPFDQWTQNDYYSLTAFFPRVQYQVRENNRRDRLDKHEFDGEQIVWLDRAGEVEHPNTKAVMWPRVPGEDRPTCGPEADRLHALGEWLARPDNPFFARAQVNRIWYNLLGRGIVEPLDDFRPSNPPANPELLDWLANDFVKHNFDLRHTVRTIMTSRTYQLSSVPNNTNEEDETNFSRAYVRPLQAEQLLDSLARATGGTLRLTGYPVGMRAGQMPGVRQPPRRDEQASAYDLFLRMFGKPERLLTCECERSEATTLAQAFQMISGPAVQEMLTEPNNRVGQLLTAGKSDDAIIDELYLAALSRYPSPRERQAWRKLLADAADRRAACEDLQWGVVNAKEFLLRR
jgi:hypothetical protein